MPNYTSLQSPSGSSVEALSPGPSYCATLVSDAYHGLYRRRESSIVLQHVLKYMMF